MGWRGLLDSPRVYADLNGGWRQGDQYTFSLNSRATEADLQRLGLSPAPGLLVDFWTDDGDEQGNPDPLLFQGVVQFDEDRKQWIAVTRWSDLCPAPERKAAPAKEPSPA
jgi:hypothetical protein